MNKSTFVRIGILIMSIRCLLASIAIINIVQAMAMKNRMINPIKKWFTDVIFYSVCTSIFVLFVSAVEIIDYTEKHLNLFKKIILSKQNIQLKSYMITTTIEALVLVSYSVNLQYTIESISREVKGVLNSGLTRYLTNTEWQIFWNTFQEYYCCCGSTHSTNWFQIAWASPITSSAAQLKQFTQENGDFIVPAAPHTCCLPNTICNIFSDCKQSDPKKYFQNGCFLVIANTVNSIAFTKYLFYAVFVIQVKIQNK